MSGKVSALICHAGDELNEEGLARWIASFSDLRVVIRIHEPASRKWRRLRRELTRIGAARMLDVAAFRIVHSLLYGRQVTAWRAETVSRLKADFPDTMSVEYIDVPNANDAASVEALRRHGVDFAIARCKQILNRRVFEVPTHGIFVLHPGICPEYRNAHGGFWALANDDATRVGTSLLRIDAGVDTVESPIEFRQRAEHLESGGNLG
jgi:hypothetical protein